MRQLADFIGRFDLSRVIEDRRAGAVSRFSGQAVIAPGEGGAVYTETGVLTLNEQQFEAERRYFWVQDGVRVAVSFADGAPFHWFDPAAGGQASAHLCGADMYRGGYDLAHWPDWSVTWDVSGPRKEYRSVTRYVPRR